MNVRTKAAAAYTGLSKSTLDKFRCFGGGPMYSKVGRSVIYNTDDLDAWLSSRKLTDTWSGVANDNGSAVMATA